ncbi:hypothetical protein [Sedimenticola thiotaurini]|uniref:hypothetical protein n=1 Tax=Sedimenticola thiotaurini TaxID=1543721 RepID=UPI00069BFEFB|nr:hypothetical protein [Sedimenticola thiotaurini]
MRLQDIQPAIALIQNNPVVTELRSHTYLSTYPDIIALGQETEIQAAQFKQLALMVYGWMPRVLRIDSAHLPAALQAANTAKEATAEGFEIIPIQHIADCLHSMVGASKFLHFINPNVFPIWDSKIQAFRGLPNGNYDMSNIENYLEYVRDVHVIAREDGFDEFYERYCVVHANRLNQSNIEEYQVGNLRAIEASAFELAP